MQVSLPLLLLKQQLHHQGINNFEEIARALHHQKNLQDLSGVYSTDRYTVNGSNAEGLVVSPYTGKEVNCILWCLNHYTGLNRNPNVIEKVCDAVKKFGTGCGTSAMSGGMNSLHKLLEVKLARLVGKEQAIVFPTGYTTNLGVISALPGKNDLIIFDREAHSSIIDGVKLSRRKFISFKHNSTDDLEKKLSKYQDKYENIIVIVESAYSMSGNLAPLRKIVALKQKYNFYLYVDEAHTFGIYGKNGAGYCQELGISEQVDFIMSTLSKSTASIGGFVACKKEFTELIKWNANSFLFQACLTPGDAAAILGSLDEIKHNPSLLTGLHEKNQYMRQELLEMGYDLGASQSPIIPVYIPDSKVLCEFNKELFEAGIFSVSVVYPAVKPNEGRIRFILNASHSYEQIDKTLSVLEKLGKKYRLISPEMNQRTA